MIKRELAALFVFFILVSALILLFACDNPENQTGSDQDILTEELPDVNPGSETNLQGAPEYDSNPAENELITSGGNVNGNIVNEGLAVYQDGWIYYCSDNGEIRRINTANNVHETIISEAARFLNTDGEWIFFMNYDQWRSLYKVTVNGSESALIYDGEVSNVILRDDWIYFKNENDRSSIYKIRPDGSAVSKINDDTSWYINVSGDWIYYSNWDDNKVIYRIRTDGSDRSRLNDDFSSDLVVYDDWIFYSNVNHDNHLYKVRIDGSDNTLVVDDQTAHINYSGGWLYYCNNSEGGVIYKIRPDGNERTSVNEDKSWFINLAGDWIFYQNADNEGIWFAQTAVTNSPLNKLIII